MLEQFSYYKIFYAVARHENISRAAKALYISQPAVSQSIKRLELALGLQLFFRSPKGVILTTEGQIFYKYIDRAFQNIIEGEKVLDELKNKKLGVITISITTTSWTHFLLPYLKSFIKQYPQIEIKIVHTDTLETLKRIDSRIVDFGIVVQPFNLTDYNFTKLADVQDIFVATKSYLKSLNLNTPNDIFSKGSFMQLSTHNITRQYIDKYLEKHHLSITPDIEIDNTDFLLEFAKIGLGITTSVKNFVEDDLDKGILVEIPITPPIPPRTVGLIYSYNQPLSIATQTFLTYFKKIRRLQDLL